MGALTDRRQGSQFHPARFFLDAWRSFDADAATARADRSARGLGYDIRPLIALTCGATLLVAMHYYGKAGTFVKIADTIGAQRFDQRFSALYPQMYWALAHVAGYFAVPALLLRLTGQRVRDQGFGWAGLRQHFWIYLVLYAIVLAAVIAISFTSAFSSFYPFYHGANRSWFDFGVWELLYSAQFFALEFFFRGWWLTACRDALGSGAIFAMIVPYTMLHLSKPAPEAFAAILAGMVLGTLAMKTRTIRGGDILHVSIAVSRDVAALLQTTGLPHQFWPLS